MTFETKLMLYIWGTVIVLMCAICAFDKYLVEPKKLIHIGTL